MRLRLIVTVVAFSLILSLLLTEIVSYSRNTLQAHPDWVSGKRMLSHPLMGARHAFFSRNLLARNRLNLHEWHGHQEILLNRIFQPGLARFRFYIGPKSYLLILLNGNSQSGSGIRLSRDTRFPNMFFRVDREGRFSFKEPIKGVSLSERWHHAEIRFLPNSVSLQLDGKPLQSFREQRMSAQVFGFRSGQYTALVDDVDVYDVSGATVIREDFQNHCTDWYAPLLLFVLPVVAAGFILRFSSDSKKVLLKILVIEFSFLIVLILYYSFDFYYWSVNYHNKKLPPRQKITWYESLERIEQVRLSFFTRFPFRDFCRPGYSSPSSTVLAKFLDLPHEKERVLFSAVTLIRSGSQFVLEDNSEAIASYLKRFPFVGEKRILFLGTSQMLGVGATLPNERIAKRVYDLLNDWGFQSVFVVNASESGSNSRELLARCKSHLHLFRPHLMVVNLSNNDPLNGFRESLQSLAAWAQSLNSKTVFVLEANSLESGASHLIPKHAVMRQLSGEMRIPLLDLHGYLSSADVYDTGILWWDFVHLTSYGQARAAEFIAEGIRKHGDLQP